jgi:hypothetical protein
VSCSPFRVPVARLAAAQAALEEEASIKQSNGAKPAAAFRKALKAKGRLQRVK